MYTKDDFKLCGLTFLNKNGKDLLSTKGMKNDKIKKQEDIRFETVTLKDEERILGVRSCGHGFKLAQHFNF
jgi:hypothetical protein